MDQLNWGKHLTGALATLVITICCYALFWRPPKRTVSTPKRFLTLRIDEVPIDKSREALEHDLKSVVERDPGLKEDSITIMQHSLVRRDQKMACATATFRTSIPANEVIRKLHQARSSLPYRFDVKFHGITPLYEGRGGTDVDVIAVPGLGSHAIGSWKSSSSNDLWLRDYLPDDVPNIRVLLYGYDTSLQGSDSRDSIEDLGSRFLESIKAFRAGTADRRPIILIGHSLGGLLIKEALVLARNRSDDPQNLDLCRACYGLLLFGVPNLGLRNEQLNSIVQGQPNHVLIRDLVVDDDSEPSPFLKRISDQFSKCCKGQYQVISFFERKRSPTIQIQRDGTLTKTGPRTFMVTQKSATSTGLTAPADENNIPLNMDHSGLVKYESRSQDEYSIVKGKLKTLVAEAKREVGRRFAKNNLTPEQERLWSNFNMPPYTWFRTSTLAKPEKGTLEWLVQEKAVEHNPEVGNESPPQRSLCMEDFISWRDSSKSESLLVTAPPGRGKSVLSNFVLGHLESEILQKPLPARKVIYYFCNIWNDEASRNANSVLRALIIQLCEHQLRLFRILHSECEDRDRFFSAPFYSLWHIFESMLRDDTYTRIYCVIDGLDVYQEGMDELIPKLTEEFSRRAEAGSPLLKLLCTSRPQKVILDLWEQSMHRILRCNAHDLDVFINSRVSSLGKSFRDDMRQSITDQLLMQADNTFLWLHVVIRKIKSIDVPTPRKIEETIKNSPQDLYDLYHRLVHGIIQRDRDNARLLAWVVYARHPLDLKELEDAMAIKLTEKYTSYEQCLKDRPCLVSDEVHKVFGTLLDINKGRVYLIHQSVKDYFQREDPLQNYIGVKPRLFLAHISMTYLSLEEFGCPSWDVNELLQEYPLLRYAASYWFSHIETAADINCYPPLQDFLNDIIPPNSPKAKLWMRIHRGVDFRNPSEVFESPSRISEVAISFDIGWLVELLLNKERCGVSGNFERNCLLKAARQKGAVLKVMLKHEKGMKLAVTGAVVEAIAASHHHSMMTLLLDRRGADVQINEEVVKAAAGNSGSGREVMTLLLDRRGADVQISEEVVKAASGNYESGKEVMTLLLDRRGADVHITEEVVKAAAGNSGDGKEVMRVLLDRREADVQITEEVVKAAAWNNWSGKEVTTLLLNRRGADVHITEEVVKAAAGNSGDGKEVMRVLLDRREADVQITEEVVKAAAWNNWSGKEVTTLLLNRRGADVQITEELLSAIAQHFDEEVMTLLLDRRGADVHISEEVVKAAAKNSWTGVEVMALLLDLRGADIHITEEVVKAAAGNDWSGNEVMTLLLDRRGADVQISEELLSTIAQGFDEEVMTLLLDRRGADIHVTEEVVKAAAGNYRSGKEVMRVLLDQRGADVQITEELLSTTAEHFDKEVMALLLDRQGADIHVTEEVVKAAAGNYRSGKEVMRVLLDQRGADVQITEELLSTTAEHFDKEVMALLLDRQGADIHITEEVVKAAAKNSWTGVEVMALLLDRQGVDIHITEEVVKAAAKNSWPGVEVMRVLFDLRRADVRITEEVVKAAAKNSWPGVEVMRVLFDLRRADVRITEEVVKAAAKNSWPGVEVMRVLLDRRGADVHISEEVVKAAAENYRSGKEVMTLLLDRRGADVHISEEVVKAAAENYRSGKEVMTLLLDRRGADVHISEEVVKAAAENYRSGKEVMTLLLDRRGADVQITEELLSTTAEHFDKEVIALLLDRRGADVHISEEVVKAAAENYRSGKEVMTLLLDRRGADVHISEEVVKAAAENYRSGKEVMTLLLDRRGADVQITEELLSTTAEHFDKEVIALLLDRRGADIHITEEVVKAAAGNSESGEQVMKIFLNRRGADVQISQ
ncbi:hypothetical protein EPUS_05851 [Endocarpon pusillum Z07020]|uniref:Uncharacterized protein n=1 Tax=Endocarpon pusillum (strain Z07020 / HMAS-L-300199) TaxID=1263415 RepID=U1GVR3_ENDPU|nr:uncharacterized protein EPUS_05851 [Endocarpon pusillum Z07020]ERF76578.1 hypothetical protein EPUS_05851 [Endocarpon pusillum Z07020]